MQLVSARLVVFGAIGVWIDLGYLANRGFADSWFFPMALSATGLGIIGSGIVWQRHEKRCVNDMAQFLPDSLRQAIQGRLRLN